MVLGSFGGDEQPFADLWVSQPLADEIDYVPLAPAEGRQRVRRRAGTEGHLGTEPSKEGRAGLIAVDLDSQDDAMKERASAPMVKG